MLLQWTLLQLASLGIDDGNKNCTGSVPNLTPLIGANPLMRPPALLCQLLLPNTPAGVSLPPPTTTQVGCQNHTSEATPVPALSHTTTSVSDTRNTSKSEENIPTVTTQPIIATTPSNDGSKLVHQGGHGDTPELTTVPALITTPESVTEPTTPTVITMVTSTNVSASVILTDDGIMPAKTATLAPATTPASVSETTPKQVTEDPMKITNQTADSATKHPYQSSEDTSQLNEELNATQQFIETGTSQPTSSALTPITNGSSDASTATQSVISVTTRIDMGIEETTPLPTETTAVPQLPLTAPPLPVSPSEVQVDVSGGTQATGAYEAVGISGKVPSNSSAVAATETSANVGDTRPSVSDDVLTSQMGIPESPPDSPAGVAADTLILSSENVPELAPGSMETPPHLMSADIILGPSQQGTLGVKQGSDTVISEPAIVPGISSAAVGTIPYVMSGGNVAGLAQQELLGLKQGSDTLLSAPGNELGITTGVVAQPAHVLTGGNEARLTQTTLGLQSPKGTDISAAATGPVLTPAVVAIPSHVLSTANAGALVHQGTLGIKPQSGTVITGSENLPHFSTGVVRLPSHLSAANLAALFPQGMHGLTPGSAHLGNSMHSQIQQAVPLEQILAPIISALLVKEWQGHPQYRFGRSVNSFDTDENSKTSIKELPQRLPDPQTRQRRSGQLFTRYQLVKSVIDKFMDMRPKTQDFLVKQGVKLSAKRVGEMLKLYGHQIKEWINGKLSSMNVDPSSYTVGDEVDSLVTNIADSLENYIKTLPH